MLQTMRFTSHKGGAVSDASDMSVLEGVLHNPDPRRRVVPPPFVENSEVSLHDGMVSEGVSVVRQLILRGLSWCLVNVELEVLDESRRPLVSIFVSDLEDNPGELSEVTVDHGDGEMVE